MLTDQLFSHYITTLNVKKIIICFPNLFVKENFYRIKNSKFLINKKPI